MEREPRRLRRTHAPLRQIALAIVALFGLWLSVLIARLQNEVAVPVAAPAAIVTPDGHVAPAEATNRTSTVLVTPTMAPPSRPPRTTSRTPVIVAPRSDVTVRPAAPPAASVETERVAAPAPEPVEGSQGTRAAADTPPPPPEPLAITGAQITALSPSSARIRWHTNLPAQTQAAYGIDTPAVWTPAGSSGVLDHEAVLTGLSFSTHYRIWLHAVDEWNRAETQTLALETAPMSDSTAAQTSGDRILLDDQPFFPLAVWGQCSDGFESNIADGINLFMGNGCGTDRQLAPKLAGRAFSIVDAKQPNVAGKGVIGWYFPDEWDAFLRSDVSRADLAPSVPAAQAGRISFLTLTNHFYSKAAPLPQGKGMYPTLMSLADVVGFDLYPLQVWCKPAFGDVYDAQRELRGATGGKPTFQWVEVAKMEHACSRDAGLDPTPATVRAETWLAVGGGAGGIGYFPNRWSPAIGDEIAHTNRQITALTPALLSPSVPVTSDSAALKVSARSLNGALYVIAVNTSGATVQARVSLDGIAGRSAKVLGEDGSVGADDKGFTDTFGPLAAKVYVVPPAGW